MLNYKTDLADYVANQISNHFPDKSVTSKQLLPYWNRTLERIDHCFSHIKAKHFSDVTDAFLNHYHSDQYAMFLYFLGNTIFQVSGDLSIATKTYLLNKALHSIDVYYEVSLPEIFYFQHPLGTVLGRAEYSNYFVAYQRCTVGGNLDLVYPKLGEGVIMFGGSVIIGDSTIGQNCWISAGTTIIDQNVSDESLVFGRSPTLSVKKTSRDVISHLFKRHL